MKKTERFLPVKKWLCAAFAALALVGFNACSDLVTSVAAPTVSIVGSKTLTAPTGFKASQGGKRKIALNWDAVGIAKSYRIYSATSPNDEFVQVGESQKPEYEDTVGSGRTYYYKVCSVNYVGDTSEFTTIVSGTSLACPVISSIEAEDNRSTVYWYMENAEAYTSDLRYDLYCQKGGDIHQATVSGDVSSYTFEGLNSNTDYTYYIEAYLASDQTATESSPKVTKDTVAQYNPVPPEFTASQGETTDSINLIITLPTMVQVQTTKTGSSAEVIVDYPLCFKIERKKTGEPDDAYKVIVRELFYNGEAKAPSSYSYKAGDLIEYKDMVSDAKDPKPGQKYDYRVRSCIDANYSKVEGYTSDVNTPSRNANVATGFAIYKPAFSKKTIPHVNPNDESKLLDVTVDFSASWNGSLGKEALYKFALLQTYTPNGASNSFTTWLSPTQEKKMFDKIEDVDNFSVCYDMSTNPGAVKGAYQYELYIIPESCEDPTTAVETKNYLACVHISGKTTITDDAQAPNTDIVQESGWPDYVKLTWTPEKDVTYTLSRVDHNIENPTEQDYVKIKNEDILSGLGMAEYPINQEITFSDTSVDPGVVYEYTLIARKGSNDYTSNDPAIAKTLGKADLTVVDYSYTDIKVSMPIVVAANTYKITLGQNSSDLGSGDYLLLNVDRDGEGNITSISYDDKNSVFKFDDNATPENNSVKFDKTITPNLIDKGTIELTIQKPLGYDKAAVSGAPANLKVTTSSDKWQTENDDFYVSTVGPAATAIAGTDTIGFDSDNPGDISVTWKGLPGAEGYAVYRSRAAVPGSQDDQGNVSNYKEATTCVYYVSAKTATQTATATIVEGGSGSPGTAVTVDASDTNNNYETTYTLVDHYKDNTGIGQWDVDQELIGLGVEYTYTVFPVLAQGDSTSRKSAYADMENANTIKKVCAAGYTKGYGIDLEASKAEYSDNIVLAWTMPANNSGARVRYPTIWYREYDPDSNNSNTWHKVVMSENTNYYELKTLEAGVSDLEPLEFAVTYNSVFNATKTKKMDKVYTTYLRSIYNAGVNTTESKNVGYMFTLPELTFNAAEKSDYSEDATWYTYNENNNQNRVEVSDGGYTLSLTNYNKKNPTTKLAEYDKTGALTWSSSLTGANAAMALTGGDHTVTITPSIGGDDTHDGILKVLRDTKHYYSVSTTRTSKSDKYKFTSLVKTPPEKTITTTRTGYAFRKITPTEFTKCVTLIMADSLNQEGSQEGTLNGASGTFVVTFSGADITTGFLGHKYHYQFSNDFRANFAKAPGYNGRLASAFKLTSPKSGEGYCIDDFTKKWGSNTITVGHESGFASCCGTLTLSCGDNFGAWNLSISATCGSGAKSVSVSKNKTDFQKWFPVELADKRLNTAQSDGTQYQDGTTCITYASPWWEQ